MTTTYKDLIDFAKQVYFSKTNKTATVKIKDTAFSVFINKKKILSFEMEHGVYECIRNIFTINDLNEHEFEIESNDKNHYNFICNYLVLDYILTCETMRRQNIPFTNKFKLKCKNGKIRDIVAPSKEIKPILKNMNKIFQAVYDKRNADFQVAYKCGKNIKSNAESHKNMKNVFKIDLHDFFPSCKKKYVENKVAFLFKNTINEEYVKNLFLDDILDNDALFIGSPISGTIANAIISKPVLYMKNICNKFNISFSVYADDMTFGSDKYLDKDFVIGIFNRAFVKFDMEEDFHLNEKKCFGQSGCNRTVTGVVINNENKLTAHRYIYNEIRQTLHQLSYGDESHLNYNKLKGKIAFMSMLDESGKLKKLLTKYKDTILNYELVSEEKLKTLGIE